jgi:hypothetical protein
MPALSMMTDAFLDFPNAGFDDERAREAVRQAAEQMNQALATFQEAVRRLEPVFREIARICQIAVRQLVRWWYRLSPGLRSQLLPRHRRETMMKRKVRHAIKLLPRGE